MIYYWEYIFLKYIFIILIKYGRVSMTRILREVKMNSTYAFFELQILHLVHKNSLGTKEKNPVIEVRVIETRLYLYLHSRGI